MKKSSIAIVTLVIFGAPLLGFLLWRFPYILDSNDHLASLIWSALLLCAILPTVHHFGSAQALKYGAAWSGIFLVLLVGYSYHEEMGGVAEKVKSNLLPFSATPHKNGSVSFMRAKDGHFQIEAYANRVPIQFMVDTGASNIILTVPDAKRLGIDGETLSYNEPIHTANGMTFGASTQIAELKMGAIVMRDVSASVCQNIDGLSLLGMSFLRRLKGFKIEGDLLTFEAPSS